ncbi:armadillo-type protein [Spinellus fusiger]|nr:armadillo-type protein [Spinellus fusiger]
MAFLSGFVKSGLSFLGKDSSAFPYTLGDKVESFEGLSVWALHQGTKKEDGSQVSIFVFDCTKNKDRIPLAKNGFKRMRTMRHPDMLRYLDGIENEQVIMFVTDPVEPLSSQIDQKPDTHLILWGLYKVANAIKFINSDCSMVHGSVRTSSLFINKAGEWKLGGFELLCSMKDESPMSLTFGGLLPDAKRYATPEIRKSGWTSIKDLPTSTVDSYHLGCLIYEVYNSSFTTLEQLTRDGNIPATMVDAYRALLKPVATRSDATLFLEAGLHHGGFLSHDFVKTNLFLENISIKDQSEKEGFFRQLDSQIDTFPSNFSKYKILPELLKAFEFGSGGAKALSAILKIGDLLQGKEYQDIIVGPITRMFTSPDRAIRVSLLDNMPAFVDHLTNKTVSTLIFPHVATGFTDTVPFIREQTVKAVLLLVPKLTDKIINYELLKYMAKLQMDTEPGIRTNTTICLGKIAKYLEPSTRKKVLAPAFTRSLRDGFHHARVAALMALTATAEYYDAQDCSARIVPCVSLLLVDKEKPVRVQAFKTIQGFITRLHDFANAMPDTAIVVSPSIPGEANPTTTTTTAAATAMTMTMTGVLGGATKGLAGWAVSSIGARFSSPSGEIEAPAASPSISNSAIQRAPLQSPASMPTPKLQFNIEEVEEVKEDLGGWGDPEIAEEFDGGWEPMETADTEPLFPIPSMSRTNSELEPAAASFHRAGNSMQLGSKKSSLAIEAETEDFFSSLPSSVQKNTMASPQSSVQKDTIASPQSLDRKNELERRREERRQRMAELRDKKKSGIGAKKI